MVKANRSALLVASLLLVSTVSATENLEVCLSGQYPSLCDYSKLNAQQATQAREAEKVENLETCLTGKYPSLCRHSLLSNSELMKVKEAERQHNLETCLTGKFRSLCKHEMLNSDELGKVRAAEQSENRKVCLDGRYPSLCNYGELTTEERKQAKFAGSAIKESGSSVTQNAGRTSISSCEDNHWVKSVTQDGEIVTLEDESVWKIDSIDQIYTVLWLPITDIVACPDRLINTDDNEQVDAIQIR